MTKIMLVEDDKSLREIYGVRLLAEGYDIVSAGDGEEALAMAIKERPTLVVSDVMMPKISGFDMLDILRSTSETKDIKVIMMTALSSEEQRNRGQSLGADRYLVKSQVGIEDVVAVVHEVLGDKPPGGQTAAAAAASTAASVLTAPTAAPQEPSAPQPASTPSSTPTSIPVNDAPAIPMPQPLSPAAQSEPPAAQPTPVAAEPAAEPASAAVSQEGFAFQSPQPSAESAIPQPTPVAAEPAAEPAPQAQPAPAIPMPQPLSPAAQSEPPAAQPTPVPIAAALTPPQSSSQSQGSSNRIIQPINNPQSEPTDFTALLNKELAKEASATENEQPSVATADQERAAVEEQLQQFAQAPLPPTPFDIENAAASAQQTSPVEATPEPPVPQPESPEPQKEGTPPQSPPPPPVPPTPTA